MATSFKTDLFQSTLISNRGRSLFPVPPHRGFPDRRYFRIERAVFYPVLKVARRPAPSPWTVVIRENRETHSPGLQRETDSLSAVRQASY